MKVGACIVGAGMSSRMKDFKPLLPFEDTTIARHIVSLVKGCGADPILMVTGYRGEELEEHLASFGIRFLRNSRYQETQMFDSIRMGIEAIAGECDKILLMPIDTPAIRPGTFEQVLRIDADMVRTVYGGEPGHPILLRSKVALELCRYQGEGGLRGAMEHSSYSITNLVVDDKGVNWDVDTRQEYESLIDWNFRRGGGYPIHPVTNVSLAAADVIFTSETALLLECIERSGSIQEACSQAGVSYSKGSRMIKLAEKQLGFPILERWTGGNGGGGSRMNLEGKCLLAAYKRMTNEIQAEATRIFQECFSEGLRGREPKGQDTGGKEKTCC